MAVDVTSIVQEAVNRSIKRNGLVLIGFLFVLEVLNALLGAGRTLFGATQFGSGAVQTNPTTVLPPLIAEVLSLAIGLASLVVTIAAIRVFVSEETERLSSEHFTRNMGWTALHVIGGTIVYGIAVALGFVALIIPGIFLLVTLGFWSVYVAVADQTFIEGFRSSWNLTRGHRLSLLLLVLPIVLLVTIINGIGLVVGPLGGGVLAQAGTAIIIVFSTAVLAAAYNELTALTDEEGRVSVAEPRIVPTDDAESI